VCSRSHAELPMHAVKHVLAHEVVSHISVLRPSASPPWTACMRVSGALSPAFEHCRPWLSLADVRGLSFTRLYVCAAADGGPTPAPRPHCAPSRLCVTVWVVCIKTLDDFLPSSLPTVTHRAHRTMLDALNLVLNRRLDGRQTHRLDTKVRDTTLRRSHCAKRSPPEGP
jgi:hypothetical protein